MRKNSPLTALCVLTIIALFLCTTSCQSTGRSRAENLQSDLTDIQESLTEGSDHVDKTIFALNALPTEQTDLTKPYEKYVDELEDLESHAKSVRKESDDLREKGQAYFEAWQKDMAAITNESLKKQSEERKEELKAAYAKIDEIKADSRKMFDTFLTNLQDIRKYLDTDLTPAGVQGIASMIEEANKESADVKTRIKELNEIIDKVKDAMTSKMPPPAPAEKAEEKPAAE